AWSARCCTATSSAASRLAVARPAANALAATAGGAAEHGAPDARPLQVDRALPQEKAQEHPPPPAALVEDRHGPLRPGHHRRPGADRRHGGRQRHLGPEARGVEVNPETAELRRLENQIVSEDRPARRAAPAPTSPSSNKPPLVIKAKASL